MALLCIFYTHILNVPLYASVSRTFTTPDAKSASAPAASPAVNSVAAREVKFAPQGVRGPLKISDNGRYFTYTDGTPFFYMGDTAWELFHRLTREEADTYLSDRAGKGFNVIQAVALAEMDGLRVPNPYGHVPFQDLDPARPNEAYWQHVDYIINKAESLGMFTGLLPSWGDKWQNEWGAGPKVFNTDNARIYGAWLANRYKNKPIIWIMGGDRTPVSSEHFEIIRAMAEGIRSVVGNSQLMTFHSEGGRSSALYFHNDSWLTFNTYQSGHYRYNDASNYQLAMDNYNRSPVKPSLNSEPAYEDHPVDWNPGIGWFDEYDVRQAAYWSVFSGGAGHTYGDHNIWQFYNHDNPRYNSVSHARTPWRQALGHPGAGQMQHLRRLVEARQMLAMVPDQGLIASGQGSGADYIAASRGEDFAFIYLSAGQNVTVNLGRVSGNELRGWWYDTRTGKATHIEKFGNNGTRAFDAPGSKNRGNDWVLILDDASKNYAAPDGTRPPQDAPANQAPVVSVTQPGNNASFTAPASVDLQANASDPDGSVTRVEYFEGNTKLGEATSAPWAFTWRDVGEGNYSVTARATDDKGASATSGAVNISMKAPAPALVANKAPVVGLTSPAADAGFTAPASVDITAGATDEDGQVVKVEYFAGSAWLGERTSSPWSFTWQDAGAGTHTLTARATDDKGAVSISAEVTIVVAAPPVPTPAPAPPVSCSATGTVLEEVWRNVTGIAVSDIPLQRNPDASGQLTVFEAARNSGDNYGRRVRGYLCPPATGEYTFWLASDDAGELYLSTDENPVNRKRIASVSGWARPGEWEKYPSQKSAKVRLEAGRRYYIEALQKDGTGADYLAVGWQLPDGAMERPIPGSRLSPYVPASPEQGPASAGITSCDNTGGLLREFWANVRGCEVKDIPVNARPAGSSIINSFEGPINFGTDYASRLRGYICPPVTGEYTFWLASDDASELYLSTDEDPANKRRISSVSGWTNPREWEKYPTQKSVSIRLETGRRYYVEVLHKDCLNGDYVGVGWQLPGGALERPIPGPRLIPFHTEAEQKIDILERAEVFPNPASSSATLRFYSNDDHDAEIVVTNSLAMKVLTVRKQAKAGRNEVLLQLDNLQRGVYYINVDNEYAEKLIIAR